MSEYNIAKADDFNFYPSKYLVKFVYLQYGI